MPTVKTNLEKILSESAYLFKEKGYYAATLREIAQRCGIKGGSVYYHVSSKQQLLFQLMNFVLDELTSFVTEAIENTDDSKEQLRKAITVHIHYHIAKLNETYVTDSEIRGLNEENHKIILEKRKKYEKIFIDLIEKGIAKKTFRDVDTKLCVFSILQMCTGISYWYKSDGRLTVEKISDEYFKFIYMSLVL